MNTSFLHCLLFCACGFPVLHAAEVESATEKSAAFSFAILADNTGGSRPGILADAVRKTNLLNPAFVLGIGDLIEGGQNQEAQWAEIDAILQSLRMPFYPIPGNHDIQKQQDAVWKARYQVTYRHFVHEGALFLLLNSEEGGYGILGDEQVRFVADVLKAHPSPRWTFVLVHQPMWRTQRNNGWRTVERLLKNRPHTVFSGHTHFYEKNTINGHDYITLATTGGTVTDGKHGDSRPTKDGHYIGEPRGVEFAEFDHITWVSLPAGGGEPLITHLDLKGIYDKDVRTVAFDPVYADTTNALEFWHNPIFIDQEWRESEGALQIKNRSDLSFKAQLSFSSDGQLQALPASSEIAIGPQQIVAVPIRFSAISSMSARNISGGTFHVKVFPEGLDASAQPVTFAIPVLPARRYEAFKFPTAPVLDGSLKEWETAGAPFHEIPPPQDPGHRGGRFAVGHHAEGLYIGFEVKDPDVVRPSGLLDDVAKPLYHDFQGKIFKQSAVEIRLGLQADPLRSRDNGWQPFSDHLQLAFFPPDGTSDTHRVRGNEWPAQIQSKLVKTATGYQGEVFVPRDYLRKLQGNDDLACRINITIHDLLADGDFIRYSWQPDWRAKNTVWGSGTFLLK